ncbi:MAG: helix-turn-helix domain-containing protein [Steroidobacteraceae bacterium]
MSQTLETSGLSESMPGEWLQQARIKMAMSIEHVAKELNLDICKVEAIEASHFAELGASVYAKGYLRRYARLVNVPESALLNRYEACGVAPAEVTLIPATLGSIPERRPGLPRWVWRLVMVLIVAAGVVTALSMRTHTDDVAVDALQSQRIDIAPVAAPPLETLPTDAATSSDAVTTERAATGQVVLTFNFSGDSWVEVYAENNQQVLYEMVRAGGSRSASVLPPTRVVLGSAAAVTVQVNATPAAIPADHIVDNVARFVVNASGEIE